MVMAQWEASSRSRYQGQRHHRGQGIHQRLCQEMATGVRQGRGDLGFHQGFWSETLLEMSEIVLEDGNWRCQGGEGGGLGIPSGILVGDIAGDVAVAGRISSETSQVETRNR